MRTDLANLLREDLGGSCFLQLVDLKCAPKSSTPKFSVFAETSMSNLVDVPPTLSEQAAHLSHESEYNAVQRMDFKQLSSSEVAAIECHTRGQASSLLWKALYTDPLPTGP